LLPPDRPRPDPAARSPNLYPCGCCRRCWCRSLTPRSRLFVSRVYTKAGTYIHSRTWHIQLTGGTLSECAARERIGGTFHSGNVPGLAPTNLGKDTCLCSLRTPPLFLLPPPPLAPTSPPTRQKSAKMTTDGTDNSKHMAPTSCSLTRTRSRDVNLTSTPHVRRAMGHLLTSWIDAYITSSRAHLTFSTTNVLIFPR
jgi:hypothetical protein